MSLAPIPGCALLLAAWQPLHAPHDNAYSVAVGFLPDGGEEVVVVTDDSTVLSSRDNLLHFGLVSGNGLDTVRPTCVTYNASLAWSNGQGRGIFLIGTERGVWAYEPSSLEGLGPVRELDAGIPANNQHSWIRAIASSESAAHGPQPSFVLTRAGEVYRLNLDQQKWTRVLDTGVPVRNGAIVLAADFDAASGGENATVFVAADEQLWRSRDGGRFGSWSRMQSFPGWSILSVACDADYGVNPNSMVYVGLGRVDSGGDEGEVRRSADDGLHFQRVLRLPVSVTALAAAPPGPTRGATLYVGGREYPNTNGYVGIGIPMSRDRGQTFDDEGNEQSFQLEHDPGGATGYTNLRYVSQLYVMPQYGLTGRVLYARNEGLFLSPDEGHAWQEASLYGSEEQRAVGMGVDPAGHLHVFSTSDGQGIKNRDLSTGREYAAPVNLGQVFSLPLAVSPDFTHDGAVYAGGTSGISAWFDPAIQPANNDFGVLGAQGLPLADTTTGRHLHTYVRTLALSPHFSAAPGSPEQVLFFGGYEQQMWMSTDAGRTCSEAKATSSGGPLPYISELAFAPTFVNAAPYNDLYAIAQNGSLWRLTDGLWTQIADLGAACTAIVVDPRYDSVSNRRLWVAANNGAGVFQVLDLPVPQITPAGKGLPPLRLNDLAVGVSAGETWLYAASWADGIYRARLVGEAPWEKLSSHGYPRAFSKGVELPPAWPADPRVFVATGDGAFLLPDQDRDTRWKRLDDSQVWDNIEASVLTYSPNDPAVADPTQPTLWDVTGSGSVPRGVFGEDAALASHNGDYLLFHGYGNGFRFLTWAGPRYGRVTLSAHDPESGRLLGQRSVDLRNLPPGRVELRLDLGFLAPVPILGRVDISLNPGEDVLYDGILLTQ